MKKLILFSLAFLCCITCYCNRPPEPDPDVTGETPVFENEWTLDPRPGFESFHGYDQKVFELGMQYFPDDYNPKRTFHCAQLRMLDFELNGIQASKAEAFLMMENALNNLNSNDPPFQLWGAMDCYLRWRHLMPEPLRKLFRTRMINTTEYDYHNTQNKHIMSATARFLATETWPEAHFVSHYSAADPTGREKIIELMDAYVLQGEREHNSSTYFAMHFGSILSLADLAQDPEIRKRAKMVVDWLLISAAAEWQNGYWAAAAERVYRPFREYGQYRAGTMYMYLYFGGYDCIKMSYDLHWVFQGLCAQYRMPDYIYKLSQKRNEPYLHRETHLHPISGGRIFYLQTYMAHDFAVFSQHEAYETWPTWMNQMIRWGIHLNRDQEEMCLFIQHPHGGKSSAPEFGETEYGQVFQHETTVIGIYDIPPDSKHPYLKGWIPSNAEAVIDSSETSGMIFLHYGTTAIALQLSESTDWSADETNFFIRDKGKVGFAAEVYPAENLAGATALEQLESLANKIEQETVLSLDFSSVPTIKYTDSRGQDLESRLHEGDYLNGVQIDYTKWPLLSNPWVEQAYEGKILELEVDGQRVIYDFENWEVSIQ